MVGSMKIRMVATACVGFAAGGAGAGPVTTVFSQPTLDRWMYPFNGTPGTRPEASVFGSVLYSGFDDRDAEFLVGFDTTSVAAPGQGAGNYVISALRIRATISQGDRFVYDPTWDSVATSYDPTDPLYVPDSDAGKPIEIFACGPTPMLAATARLARRYALPCQVSLEEFMACAVGGCAGCTVAVTTDDGPAMKRVCVDGPVLDAYAVFAGEAINRS